MTEILDEHSRVEKIEIRNMTMKLLEGLTFLACFYSFVTLCRTTSNPLEQILFFFRLLVAIIYIIWFQVESKAVEGWDIRDFFPMSMSIISILLIFLELGISILLGRELFNDYINNGVLLENWELFSIIFAGLITVIFIFMTRYRVEFCKRIQKQKR